MLVLVVVVVVLVSVVEVRGPVLEARVGHLAE